MEKNIELWRSIFGWFSFEEVYHSIISEAPDNSLVIEMGVFAGKSTCYMIKEIYESKKHINFFAIDRFTTLEPDHMYYSCSGSDKFDGSMYLVALDNVKKTGIANSTSVLNCNLYDFLDWIKDGEAWAIFLDTDHEYETTLLALERIWPKISDGGFMAGHDYCDIWPGVIQAVNKWASDHNVKFTISGINFIFRKNVTGNVDIEFKRKMEMAAKRWGEAKDEPRNWWCIQKVKDHIARQIPFGGMHQWLGNILQGRVLNNGISIGFGEAQKEIALLQTGHVNKIYGYEIAQERVEIGRMNAKNGGVSDRFIPILSDGVLPRDGKKYDLVHWDCSLHHMVNVDEALRWSHEVLNDDGILYIDDYVGKNQMQWGKEELELANSLRREMPEYWFHADRPIEWYNQRELLRGPLSFFRDCDPTEMIDCEAIIPSIKKYFPNPNIFLTGGIFYFLSMMGLWPEYDEIKDEKLLDYFLQKDKECADNGYTSYAVCIHVK